MAAQSGGDYEDNWKCPNPLCEEKLPVAMVGVGYFPFCEEKLGPSSGPSVTDTPGSTVSAKAAGEDVSKAEDSSASLQDAQFGLSKQRESGGETAGQPLTTTCTPEQLKTTLGTLGETMPAVVAGELTAASPGSQDSHMVEQGTSHEGDFFHRTSQLPVKEVASGDFTKPQKEDSPEEGQYHDAESDVNTTKADNKDHESDERLKKFKAQEAERERKKEERRREVQARQEVKARRAELERRKEERRREVQARQEVKTRTEQEEARKWKIELQKREENANRKGKMPSTGMHRV